MATTSKPVGQDTQETRIYIINVKNNKHNPYTYIAYTIFSSIIHLYSQNEK